MGTEKRNKRNSALFGGMGSKKRDYSAKRRRVGVNVNMVVQSLLLASQAKALGYQLYHVHYCQSTMVSATSYSKNSSRIQTVRSFRKKLKSMV